MRKGSSRPFGPEIVINASGAWADDVATMAGCRVPLSIDMGAMVVLNGRLVSKLVNHLRPPSNGDILVPNCSGTIIGTTSKSVSSMNVKATGEDVDLLLQQSSSSSLL